MATQRAKDFLKTVTSDVTLRHQLENAQTPEQRRAVINAAGFSDVTKEDLTEAVKESAAPGDASSAEIEAVGELSDAELEAVAGGKTTTWLSAVTVLAATAL